MKFSVYKIGISLLLGCSLFVSSAVSAQTDEIKKLAGYVDLGDLTAAYGEPNVEINLGPSMLKFASAIMGDEDPEALAVMKGLKAIRVRIYNIEGKADAAINQINKSRKMLLADHWEQIVSVKEDGEENHIFVKMVNGTVEGMTVLVAGDDDEAIFINIIGQIKPEDLGKITGSFDVDIDL